MSNSLSQALVRLYQSERFYAELALQMDRIVSKTVPTIGVCIKDRVQLHVNMEFFDSLTEKEQVAVLKHECDHILHNHIERAKELAPDVYTKQDNDSIDSMINGAKHTLINIAADCSINPGIQNIPEGGAMPSKFKLPDGKLMEWYVSALKDHDDLKQLTRVGDHSLWGESEGDKDEIKAKIKKVVEDAAEKTRFVGRMTNELELLVERLCYRPKDWKGDLKRFAARALETAVTSSKKKRNRRYGIMYPGVIKEEVLHIGVAIDTSGSISDEALNQFMAEVGQIAKYATVTVVEADSTVKNSYLFDPKKTYKVKGRGGTAYQPAFDYFTSETNVDGVIYFGDMDCYDSEEIRKPKYPVLWAIIGNQKPPVPWGSVTAVEVKRR